MSAANDDDVDWSNAKGVADEANFNEFVLEFGGSLVAPMIERQGVKNADYLFADDKIVGEHKIIETDFAQHPDVLVKVDAALSKYSDEDISDLKHPIFRDLFGILRIPLRRIIEKANKQIKETKLELGLVNHRGVLFLVNDEFKSAPPPLVMNLVGSILREKERYRSVDALVYITNHYVEVAENQRANLLWVPSYKNYPSDQLVEFVDNLGSRWSDFMEGKLGPFDGSWKSQSINWDRVHVVRGPRRVERYEGDD